MATLSGTSAWGNWVLMNTASSSTAVTGTVWQNWQTTITSNCTSASNLVWSNWSASSSDSFVIASESEEARAAREARAAEADERRRVQEQERAAADAKARELLLSILLPWQKEQFEKHGWFLVKSKKHVYRIRRGWSANIDRLDADGKVTDQLCIHPRQAIPLADLMAAQKLMLETDAEEQLLATAYRHHPYSQDAVSPEILRQIGEVAQELVPA